MALKIITTIASIIIESFCVSFFLLAVFTFINKDGECYYNDKKRFLRFWLINSICVILNRIIHIFLPDLKWLKPISPMLVFPLSAYINYKIKYFKVLVF